MESRKKPRGVLLRSGICGLVLMNQMLVGQSRKRTQLRDQQEHPLCRHRVAVPRGEFANAVANEMEIGCWNPWNRLPDVNREALATRTLELSDSWIGNLRMPRGHWCLRRVFFDRRREGIGEKGATVFFDHGGLGFQSLPHALRNSRPVKEPGSCVIAGGKRQKYRCYKNQEFASAFSSSSRPGEFIGCNRNRISVLGSAPFSLAFQPIPRGRQRDLPRLTDSRNICVGIRVAGSGFVRTEILQNPSELSDQTLKVRILGGGAFVHLVVRHSWMNGELLRDFV